ncbi:acyl-CoA thioesterase/bile acid-CoA:amino acid N-acyltransferase family protein [Natribacillus halophilus]|uniref:Acyl-CoA thioester hydrolase/BAAT N-terminal region n=1 Tax=Natribacillus halophilus TaxID=549003 RepID=A0A1G8NGW9_9BACI|nr:acyl-CoA thioester hydrolase/BAAT C-terminal domain-containing protein [Natribacillus halophilus]SDI79484.1 Acyl-CoA thioester hydrolase/BAAT N-terminal region [Natribacillus halophilus]
MVTTKPSLSAQPIDTYVDEDLNIFISDCPANDIITLRATANDDEGKLFESYAKFRTDSSGRVNVSQAQPVEGCYEKADPHGLFWSMQRAGSKLGDYFLKNEATPLSVEINLEMNGHTIDTVTVLRHFYKNDIKRVVVKEHECMGVLFHPIDQGPCPGILLLGGSDGGVLEQGAALLASHGYSVLSLAYFGTEGVPKNLENIPLEYFESATAWLKKHTSVNGRVSVIGFSRGGELALLLGATFDDYQAIIAGAPSMYVTAGLRNNTFAPIPSWTYRQETLPYMKFSYRPSIIISMLKRWLLKSPVSFQAIWNHTLRDTDKIKDSRIPVENINAPVMTIAGGDDQLWPSAYYTEEIKTTLAVENSGNQNVYLTYDKAGHFLSFPYALPSLPTNTNMHVGGGMTMTFGGTKWANAQATSESWLEILAFLKTHTTQ